MADAAENGAGAPKTVEEALAVINKQGDSIKRMETALAEANKESKERKEKLRELTQKEQDAESKRLQEEGKFKELVQNLEPKAKRADELEKVIKEYYDSEVADIPEEKRTLIPQGSVETQLSWLKIAKAQGIFTGKAPEPKKAPANSEQKKVEDPNAPQFLDWKPNDPRLTTLNAAQYGQWKSHNGRDGKVAGNQAVGWGRLPA